MSEAPPQRPIIALVAIIGALAILMIFAMSDAYAVRACLGLAETNAGAMPDLCAPEHLFRTALEIGGMAIGLYGATRLLTK